MKKVLFLFILISSNFFQLAKAELDIKNLNSIEFKSSKDVFNSWNTLLNSKIINDLTKSVVKVELDKMDQSYSNGDLVPFRENLEYLFGKRKKYLNENIQRTSQEKLVNIFVKKKSELQKYPFKAILGMAYFEFYYAKILTETREKVEEIVLKRKNKKETKGNPLSFYPNGLICSGPGNMNFVCDKIPISKINSLYFLNEVRKKMRANVGLSIQDEPSDVISQYISLSKYLKNAKPEKQKLSSIDKKKIKLSQSFNGFLSLYEKDLQNLNKNNFLKKQLSSISMSQGSEIYTKEIIESNKKRFLKNADKNYNKIKKSLLKIEKIKNNKDNSLNQIKEFKYVYKNIEEIISITHKNLPFYSSRYDIALDSIHLIRGLIQSASQEILVNKYNQIWSPGFDIEAVLNENEIFHLNALSQNKRISKIINNKKLEARVLNLINNDYPINRIMMDIENILNIKIDYLRMNFKSIDEMKVWKKSDWANSWKTEIPLDLNDGNGNLIDFSNQNIEDLKAQLALNNFNTLIENDDINSLGIETQSIENSIQDIKSSNISTLLNQDFSVTLNNYSKILAEDAINRFGDQFDSKTIQQIRDNANFENLTTITNLEYGTNMTSDEYKSYWENAQYMESTSTWGDVTRGVDLISQLGSFDAASIAKDLGTDLSTVADSIVAAANVGVSTNLEQAAQGLGYSSFAEAVDAYNKQYGTSYTEETAKEALGQ